MDLNQELLYEMVMMLETEWLSQKTIWVMFTSNLCHLGHVHSHSFPHPMIDNSIGIILEGDRGNGAVCY